MKPIFSTHSSDAKKWSTKTLTLVGLMAALLCIFGPLSLVIPGSPVPISLGTLAVYFTSYVLGMKKGCASCLIYILLGLIGLPVYSGFASGPGKFFGPTGGYLIGYLFLALICGFFVDKWADKWYLCLAGMLLGTAACYFFGTLWLAFQAGMSFQAALMAGVIPFIPGDLVKIVIALLLGSVVRKALKRAGLI